MKNQINLDKIRMMKLCNELAKLTYELKQNKHVECIYFAPFKNFGDEKGNIIDITVVSDELLDVDLDKQYKHRVSKRKQLESFGVKIIIDNVSKDGYTHMPVNPSERRKGNDIFNSTILFDRTGEYTKIKEKTENIGVGKHSRLFYYENLAEIVPPIDDDLEYAMDTEQIKIMNKTMQQL